MRYCALIAICTLAALHWAPTAAASTSCNHTGPPQNELRVLPFQDPDLDLDFADGEVYREGNAIKVTNLDPIACAGPPATLTNTDKVTIVQSGLAFNKLSLAGGPLWPGGSPEADGTDETEVHFLAERGALGYAEIVGTDGRDLWALARQPGAVGISLSPERRNEFDVILEGTGVHIPVMELRGGDDAFGVSVPARYGRKLVSLVFAGKGDDVVTGQGGKYVLLGGKGNDLLVGGTSIDSLAGGPGKDRLVGGKGRDGIKARDGGRDVVRCGPGNDAASVDRKDKVSGCEKLDLP